MKRIIFLVLTLVCFAAGQPADTTSNNIGAYLGYVSPQGKFSDFKSGVTLGASYSIPFDADQIRFRLDLSGFDPQNKFVATYVHVGAFAEYVANVSPALYAFAGLGVMLQGLSEHDAMDVSTMPTTYYKVKSVNETGVAGVAGVGYDLISRKSFILSSEIRGTLGISGFDYTSMQLVIVGRFVL